MRLNVSGDGRGSETPHEGLCGDLIEVPCVVVDSVMRRPQVAAGDREKAREGETEGSLGRAILPRSRRNSEATDCSRQKVPQWQKKVGAT